LKQAQAFCCAAARDASMALVVCFGVDFSEWGRGIGFAKGALKRFEAKLSHSLISKHVQHYLVAGASS
jgi:hypothetical protein